MTSGKAEAGGGVAVRRSGVGAASRPAGPAAAEPRATSHRATRDYRLIPALVDQQPALLDNLHTSPDTIPTHCHASGTNPNHYTGDALPQLSAPYPRFCDHCYMEHFH